MYKDKKLVESHFRKTEELIRNLDSKDIAEWLLNFGYYPESNILPPSFCISNFKLNEKPYNKKLTSPARRSLIDISYPKSLLTSRKFSIQHPFNYHDIVYYLNENWNKILDIIFHKDLKIYSYSSPIPVSARAPNKLSNLREGRMIYEWIEMAEKDIVVDSTFYLYLAKTDITNFYASIYTHSIAWALHGRENALADTTYQLFGNKIDKLVQYANDARTNGLAIGSALSDLIAEIILSSIDLSISNSLSEVDFIAVRFKDDYRVLCQSENDAKLILKTISIELSKFNLILNENKTSIYKLPDGLYRVHDREYFPHSIRSHKKISFKTFEHTLLIALDIHRKHPGTSILEKFFSELFDKEKQLKIKFSTSKAKMLIEIKKTISLILLVKRESEKTISHILSIISDLYLNNIKAYPELKEYLRDIISKEISLADRKGSAFEVVWYVFFSRYIGLGIDNFDVLVSSDALKNNLFCKTMINSNNELFKDAKLSMFKTANKFKQNKLANLLDVFKK